MIPNAARSTRTVKKHLLNQRAVGRALDSVLGIHPGLRSLLQSVPERALVLSIIAAGFEAGGAVRAVRASLSVRFGPGLTQAHRRPFEELVGGVLIRLC